MADLVARQGLGDQYTSKYLHSKYPRRPDALLVSVLSKRGR